MTGAQLFAFVVLPLVVMGLARLRKPAGQSAVLRI